MTQVPEQDGHHTRDAAGVVAVLNARAGSASGPGARQALAVLAGGCALEVARTTSRDDLRAVIDRLDGRRLVVMGGDGSINAALTALRSADQLREAGPIGVVPLGTGNDLARSLGLPVTDPAAAAHIALAGRARGVELVVEDGGGVVVNAVHAGIGVAAAVRADRLKPRLGALAYPVGAVVAGAAVRPWHLRVLVDGEVVHDGRSGVLLVALTIGTSIGGGAPLSPGATPHDGLMDVVISAAHGVAARAGFAATMARGRHIERRDTSTARGTRVVVEAVDNRPFMVNADGDLSRSDTRFAWRAFADAWQVLLP